MNPALESPNETMYSRALGMIFDWCATVRTRSITGRKEGHQPPRTTTRKRHEIFSQHLLNTRIPVKKEVQLIKQVRDEI